MNKAGNRLYSVNSWMVAVILFCSLRSGAQTIPDKDTGNRSTRNACLDYGFGTKGSSGFFGNLGEVF